MNVQLLVEGEILLFPVTNAETEGKSSEPWKVLETTDVPYPLDYFHELKRADNDYLKVKDGNIYLGLGKYGDRLMLEQDEKFKTKGVASSQSGGKIAIIGQNDKPSVSIEFYSIFSCNKKITCSYCGPQNANGNKKANCIACVDGLPLKEDTQECGDPNAIECPEGTYLEENKCVECSQSTFWAKDTKKCIPCHENCLECSGPDEQYCTKCHDTKKKYLYQGHGCLEKCPASMKPFGDNVCYFIGKCTEKCEKCRPGEKIADLGRSFECEICKEGYLMDGLGWCGCDENCETCDQERDVCTSCKPNSAYPYLEGNECRSKCSNGYVLDQDKKNCVEKPPEPKCLEGCKLCVAGDVCSKCLERYTLDPERALEQCDSCPEGCLRCTKRFDRKLVTGKNIYKFKCLECDQKSQKKILRDFSCIRHCPEAEFQEQGSCRECEIENCLECKSATVCQRCQKEFEFKVDSQKCEKIVPKITKESCTEKQFFNQKFEKCEDCSPRCLRCEGNSDRCTTCDQSGKHKYKKGPNCLARCPVGTTHAQGQFTCLKCDDMCATCRFAPKICLTCTKGLEKVGDDCLKKCLKNEYREPIRGRECQPCSKNCLECLSADECKICEPGHALSQDSSKCEAITCGEHQYITKEWQCAPCLEGCSKCPNSLICEKCENGYILNKKSLACDLECPERSVLQISAQGVQSCAWCSPGCRYCPERPEICEGCQEGYFLNSTNECQLKCQENEAWLPPNDCQPCKDCLRCLNVTKTCYEVLDFMFYQIKERIKGIDIALGVNVYVDKKYVPEELIGKGALNPFSHNLGWSSLESFNLRRVRSLDFHSDAFRIKLFDLELKKSTDQPDRQKPEKSEKEENLEENMKDKNKFTELSPEMLWNKQENRLILTTTNIPENLDLKLYSLKTETIKPKLLTNAQEKAINWIYFIKPRTQSIKFNHNQKIDKDRLAQIQDIGKLYSDATSNSVHAFYFGTLFLMTFNIDHSGALLKFSQIIKLLSRLRYINIDFGAYLGAFLDHASNGFDQTQDLSDEKFNELSPQIQGKLSYYKVSLVLSESRYRIRVILYLIVATLSHLVWTVLKMLNRVDRTSQALLKTLVYIRRVHLGLFKGVVVDVAFIGVRTFLHTDRRLVRNSYLLAGFCSIYCLFDVIEILAVCQKFSSGVLNCSNLGKVDKGRREARRKGLKEHPDESVLGLIGTGLRKTSPNCHFFLGFKVQKISSISLRFYFRV